MSVDTSGLELGKVAKEVKEGAIYAHKEEKIKEAEKSKKHFLVRHKNGIILVTAVVGGGLLLYHVAKSVGKGITNITDSLNPSKILGEIGDGALKPFAALQGSFDIEKFENSLMQLVPKQNLFELGEEFIVNSPSVFKPELDGYALNPQFELPNVNVDLKGIFAEYDFFNTYHQETGEKATDLGLTKNWIF
jgi:hypothetical protein